MSRGRARDRGSERRAPRAPQSTPRAPREGKRSGAREGRAVATPARSAGTRLALVIGAVLLVDAALVIQLPSLSAPFFADDYLFLDQVRGHSLASVLAAPDPIGNFFRPVGRQIYFWIMTHVLGERPAAFHAFGLIAFLGCAALLFALARALAGTRAAFVAAGFLVLHYASDVPLRWASGSQDLLAVLGALAALYLHARGRSLLAAVALLAGLFSKETVLLTPFIAVIAARRPQESWARAARRAWPLFAALLVWGVVWLSRSRHAFSASSGVTLDPRGALGALAHLVQVFAGWEWRRADLTHLSIDPRSVVATACVVVGLAFALPKLRERRPSGAREAATEAGALESSPAPDPRRAARVGLAWALLATIPIVAVATIWSAYYYLFAMCGAALALGAWASRRSNGVAIAAVALLGVGSAMGRSLDDFAVVPSAWTGQSHINRFYLERATRQSGSYLAALKRGRPKLEPHTTLFVAGVKGSVGFQTADGPLMRWAYRDSTVHSYFVHQFSRARAGNGPVLLVLINGDSLSVAPPGVETFGAMAFSLALNEHLSGAREALAMLRERGFGAPLLSYFEGWMAWDGGDTTQAKQLFAPWGVQMGPGPTPEIAMAQAALASGDTLGARAIMRAAVSARGRDPEAHALLADIGLLVDPDALEPLIETLAARTLDPNHAYAWRRVGLVQMHHGRIQEAIVTFDHYFKIAGREGERDFEARQWMASMRAAVPAGGGPQTWLRE